MDTSLELLLVLTAILAIIHIVQAQDQKGIIYLITFFLLLQTFFFVCLTNYVTNVLFLTSALVLTVNVNHIC